MAETKPHPFTTPADPSAVTPVLVRFVASVGADLDEAAAWWMRKGAWLRRVLSADPQLQEAWEIGQHCYKLFLKRRSFELAQLNGTAGVTTVLWLRKFAFGEFERVVPLTADQINALIFDLERERRQLGSASSPDGTDAGEHRATGALARPPGGTSRAN